MSKFRTYIDEIQDELYNKVSWPTWAELQSSAIVVLIATLMVSLLIFLMDFGFSKIMGVFYQFFQ
ncbi:MAG TPA: preprotein translocase subunit SecE [Bacteroidia bacterium]|jgi:preprotein translocase subunit SecE|nr:preprotein translocase subunit SecE [Bacteroidia bacterium]